MRRLPAWLADGPVVSDVAYRVVMLALEPVELDDELAAVARSLSLVAVAQHVAGRLDVDEADVLRAWAELVDVGVLATNKEVQS
jgi:hypothetical protein